MEEMKKVLTREEAELTKENIWATEDLYVSDAAWEEDLKRTDIKINLQECKLWTHLY